MEYLIAGRMTVSTNLIRWATVPPQPAMMPASSLTFLRTEPHWSPQSRFRLTCTPRYWYDSEG
eukprot:1764026-Pyramimonas_sp.AAC.1